MANSFTLTWSFPWDDHTYLNWSAYLGFSTVVCLYHAPALQDFEQTSCGGLLSFDNPPSQGLSLGLFPSTMPKHSQMQAQSLASQSLLEIGGEPGDSFQAGRCWMGNVISAGLKPLPSNVWPDTWPIMEGREDTLSCMETTEELLKAGEMDGATAE